MSIRSLKSLHRSNFQFPPDPKVLIGIIADEETTVGFLLAGIGEEGHEHKKTNKNYFMVDNSTPVAELEKHFSELYHRKDIGVLLIASDIFPKLEQVINKTTKVLPIILPIPTKNAIVQYLKESEAESKLLT